MNRRSFPQAAGKASLATGLTSTAAQAYIPEHNWEKYDWGVPKPVGIRQVMLMLPQGTDWKGLKLKTELEVEGVRYPVKSACHQQTNPDGSLTLERNVRP